MASVELTDEESVDGRGARRIHWFARVGSAWVKASELPGAQSKQLDPRPGSVYVRLVSLELATGTELMRVESRPDAGGSRDVLDYLMKQHTRARRKTRRSYYRVGARGQLTPIER